MMKEKDWDQHLSSFVVQCEIFSAGSDVPGGGRKS